MADKEKKEEITLEDLQKQIGEVTTKVKSLEDENTQLKETIKQKDLEIAKYTLGAVQQKSGTKEVKEDEDVEFDFDF